MQPKELPDGYGLRGSALAGGKQEERGSSLTTIADPPTRGWSGSGSKHSVEVGHHLKTHPPVQQKKKKEKKKSYI